MIHAITLIIFFLGVVVHGQRSCFGEIQPARNAPQTVINAFPKALDFYAKYLDANGIPIMSSANVADDALYQYAFLVNMMLRKRPDIRSRLQKEGIKVAVIGRAEHTTDLPEYANLNTAQAVWDWNTRTRGVGATWDRPASSAAEENLLCLQWAAENTKGDRYFGESIGLHEFAHTMLSTANDTSDATLMMTPDSSKSLMDAAKEGYASSMAKGLWKKTYAATTVQEWWAVGAQIWHSVGRQTFVDGVWDGRTNTRADLKQYDPVLYDLLSGVFCDDDWVGRGATCPGGAGNTCNFNGCGYRAQNNNNNNNDGGQRPSSSSSRFPGLSDLDAPRQQQQQVQQQQRIQTPPADDNSEPSPVVARPRPVVAVTRPRVVPSTSSPSRYNRVGGRSNPSYGRGRAGGRTGTQRYRRQPQRRRSW